MFKTIKRLIQQQKETFRIPRKVQDLIPINRIWKDGIFRSGNMFNKTYRFSHINYQLAALDDKKQMFFAYSAILNGLDSNASTKITVNNHPISLVDFESTALMTMRGDDLDIYRKEYNDMLVDKTVGSNGIKQDMYITVSIQKRNIQEARAYFARIGPELASRFAALGSRCIEVSTTDRLRILHDFYRPKERDMFRFDMSDMMRRGHDFRDYICPDYMEKHSDYLKIGDRYQMATLYGFTTEQCAMLDDLLADDKDAMWGAVLYGIHTANEQLVAVAQSQIGNIGGQPYWSWYGFSSRVEWCACFVSWCANECGYIDAGVIPKFSGCIHGVKWFKDRYQWVDGDATPVPGMIIFFDWDSPNGLSGPQDGRSDHVGIVEKVENGRVYTIEGNRGDSCTRRSYPIGYYQILGYGVPAY